jgi:hypothetical protein
MRELSALFYGKEVISKDIPSNRHPRRGSSVFRIEKIATPNRMRLILTQLLSTFSKGDNTVNVMHSHQRPTSKGNYYALHFKSNRRRSRADCQH